MLVGIAEQDEGRMGSQIVFADSPDLLHFICHVLKSTESVSAKVNRINL